MDKKQTVKNIFDSISAKYDILNHLLSFGIDRYWRRKALKLTGLSGESVLLDVACGTGDVAIEARRQGVNKIIGTDFSVNMLCLFKEKTEWIDGKVVQSIAELLPFKENIFSNITVAFGVRNFYDIRKGFKSFHRVLKPNGKATIIEFSMPGNKPFRVIYKFYFKKILPLIGGIISGNKKAYDYLHESVESFDENIRLEELLEESGFKNTESYSLTFGIVQVVIATK